MGARPVFADAGVGLLVIPILGGLGVAGVFLAAGVVTGGIWLVQGSAAPRARRWFLTIAAVMSLGTAMILALIAETQPEYWIGAAVMAAVGVLAILVLRKPPAPQRTANLDDPAA